MSVRRTEASSFDPDMDRYLPCIKPMLTSKGTINFHQPRIPIKKQGLDYWQVQCTFQGLHQSGMLANLQQCLQEASDGGGGLFSNI